MASNLGLTGAVYYYSGDYTKALEFYQQAYTINKELNNQLDMAANLSLMGVAYYYSGDFTKALEVFQLALCIYGSINNSKGTQKCQDWLYRIQRAVPKLWVFENKFM